MDDETPSNPPLTLLGEAKTVVNVGVDVFEEAMRRQGIEVVVVRWRPPLEMPKDIADLLDGLL